MHYKDLLVNILNDFIAHKLTRISLNAECFAWGISFASIEVKYCDELCDFATLSKGNECKIFGMQQTNWAKNWQRYCLTHINCAHTMKTFTWSLRCFQVLFFLSVSMVATSYNNNTLTVFIHFNYSRSTWFVSFSA